MHTTLPRQVVELLRQQQGIHTFHMWSLERQQVLRTNHKQVHTVIQQLRHIMLIIQLYGQTAF